MRESRWPIRIPNVDERRGQALTCDNKRLTEAGPGQARIEAQRYRLTTREMAFASSPRE